MRQRADILPLPIGSRNPIPQVDVPTQRAGTPHNQGMLALILAATVSEPLLSGFIEALNKGQRPLQAFLKEHGTASIADPTFVERVTKGTANVVPFKLVKIVENTPQALRARVEDRHGEALGLTLMLDGGKPPKITGIRLQDPESLEFPLPRDYGDWKTLAELTRRVRTDTESPALVVGYARKDAPLQVSADGVRRLGASEEAKATDLWHVGSIAKSITATLIARLIEKGKLDWDTTLDKALAGFELTGAQRKITIHELMLQRSGLPRDLGFSRAQVVRIAGGEKDPVKARERYIRDVLSRPLLHEPGTAFAYSNAGYTLLGVIAERLAGKPFEQLVAEEVFVPLKMTRTFAGAKGVPGGRPWGHLTGKPPIPHGSDEDLERMLVPAGIIWMSVDDLVRFGQAHMVGLRGRDGFLRAATVRKLHEALAEDENDDGGYGCGWVVGALRGTAKRHGHNGSNGAFVAELAIFPERELVVAAIANRGYPTEPSPPLQAVLAIAQRYAPATR